jgi:hypothetical protein
VEPGLRPAGQGRQRRQGAQRRAGVRHLFARLLAEVHPPLAGCLAVVWWKGGERARRGAVPRSRHVLAYGGNEAIAQVREQRAGHHALPRLRPQAGLALVGRAALDTQRGPATARLAAHDVARYEQQGCYSPHAFYVERGGAMAPREFALLPGRRTRQPAAALPAPRAGAGGIGGAAGWRQAAEWRRWRGRAPSCSATSRGAWSVAFSDTRSPRAHGRRPQHAGQRGRCARRRVPLVAPHARFLQTIGIAAEPRELYRWPSCSARPASPASRARRHDLARGRLAPRRPLQPADLVRIVEIEQAAERAADRLAPYAQEDPP